MPDKKSDNQPITITFTIDPAMKLNTNGQRAMAVSVVARQGEVGQVSQFDLTNWKTDLPAEVDRVMRLLMSGLTLPDFPDMGQTSSAPAKPVDSSEEVEEQAAAYSEDVEDDELASEVPAEDEGEYDIALYPAAGDAGDAGLSQPGLF